MNISADYTNSHMRLVIDEHIHSERDRAIASRRLIDGISIAQLAEEFDRTPRQMQRIVDKLQKTVFKYI